jgi:GT2 family glycosyltransferase
MKKISIITAIHNGLAFNQIYLDSLKRYTHHDFELLIIDNASTDGSADFFIQNGAVVIRNEKNFSYPYTQNQGIKVASGDYLFFLNNDIIVSPQWDKYLIDTAEENNIDIISAKGIENMGSKSETKKFDRRWKRIKYPLLIDGIRKNTLLLMTRLMYGNWEKFCAKQINEYGGKIIEGILGNNVMMTRRAIDIVGLWDEGQQAADFDLFMRVKKRSIEQADIKPCHIALGVFIHHYIRMTSKYYKVKPTPFADKDKLIPLSDKWSAEERENYHPDNARGR